MRSGLRLAVLLSATLLPGMPALADDMYPVGGSGGSAQISGPDGACKIVTNYDSRELAVPTYSVAEWQSFYNGPPPNTTLGPCPPILDSYTSASSSTWTKRPGATHVKIWVIGAGGGGGSGSRAYGNAYGTLYDMSGGEGGQGGGYSYADIAASSLSGTVTVYVPAGGPGGPTQTGGDYGYGGNGACNNGADCDSRSLFGSYVTANSGVGGRGGNQTGIGYDQNPNGPNNGSTSPGQCASGMHPNGDHNAYVGNFCSSTLRNGGAQGGTVYAFYDDGDPANYSAQPYNVYGGSPYYASYPNSNPGLNTSASASSHADGINGQNGYFDAGAVTAYAGGGGGGGFSLDGTRGGYAYNGGTGGSCGGGGGGGGGGSGPSGNGGSGCIFVMTYFN